VSLKKYIDAGFFKPEDFLAVHPLYLSFRCGVSPDTAFRHAEAVASFLGKPAFERVTKAQYEKGREELKAIRGMTDSALEALLRAGVYNTETLHETDASLVAARAGLPRERVLQFRSAAPFKKKKKRSDDIIII